MIKIQVIASDHFDFIGEQTFYFNDIILNSQESFPLSLNVNSILKLEISPSKPNELNYQILDSHTKQIKLNDKINPTMGACVKNDTFQLGKLKIKIMDFQKEPEYKRDEDWKKVLQDPRNLHPSAQKIQKILLEEDDD